MNPSGSGEPNMEICFPKDAPHASGPWSWEQPWETQVQGQRYCHVAGASKGQVGVQWVQEQGRWDLSSQWRSIFTRLVVGGSGVAVQKPPQKWVPVLTITDITNQIQGWFPLGLTALISFLSKGLSRVFSSKQFESINSLALSLLYGPTFTSIHDYWKNHSFDYPDLCQQSNVSAF